MFLGGFFFEATTIVDVWWLHLSFSHRRRDPPLTLTSIDCLALAWDWQSATFRPC